LCAEDFEELEGWFQKTTLREISQRVVIARNGARQQDHCNHSARAAGFEIFTYHSVALNQSVWEAWHGS
jgi:hypothetical protein